MSYLPVDIDTHYARAARQVFAHARKHPDIWTRGNIDPETGERYSEPCNPADKAAPDWWQRCEIFGRRRYTVTDVIHDLCGTVGEVWREEYGRHTMTLREIRIEQGIVDKVG